MANIIYQKVPTNCQTTRKCLVAFKNAYEDNQLLTFADFEPGMVSTNNNDSEQSLRPSTNFRKIKNVMGYAAIRSVLETAQLAGKTNLRHLKNCSEAEAVIRRNCVGVHSQSVKVDGWLGMKEKTGS